MRISLFFFLIFAAFNIAVSQAPSLPIDFDDATTNYDLAPFGSNMAAALVADPTDPTNMVMSTTKTAGADCWSGVTVGGTGLESAIAFSATETEFTIDVYSPLAGIPILLKVEDFTNGAISSEVLVVTTVANAWETLTFDFASGCPAPPNLANTYDKLSIFPEFTCDPDACGAPNIGTAADTDMPIYFDNIAFEGANAPVLVDPSLPIDFDDANTNYGLAPFGSNMAAAIAADPTDATNNVLSTTKTAGADCWSGVSVGGGGLDAAIAFSPTDMEISLDVYSPVVGAPILIKVEDATNGAIASEVIVVTTVANEWETLTADFTMGCPGAPDLANTYDKISIFPEFTCAPDACGGPNPGTAADSDLPFYFDNIFLGAPCTLTSAACEACGECEVSTDIDLTTGAPFNFAPQNPQPDYDVNANAGTLLLPQGSVNTFTVAGIGSLTLPDYTTDVCMTADIDVVSGSYPFTLEFRLENGTGAPGNGGQALEFNVTVDGPGMCSIGGGSAAGVPANGFVFSPGANYGVVFALADFSGNPVDADIEVEISNISLSACGADAEPPVLECAGSEELLTNGDLSGIDVPSAFPAPANYSDWEEFGDVFEDGAFQDQNVKMFGGVSGLFQDATVAAGDWLCLDADALTISTDNIAGTTIWGELKVEFYDAGGAILNGPFGTVLDDFNQSSPAVADVWTKLHGCIEVPENAVTARAIIIFLNFDGNQGAIYWDNVSMRRVSPMSFEVNADGCSANVSITDPVPTDDCGVASLVNSFNGTDNADGNYPLGTTMVTYTATDDNGNQSVCSILVEAGDATGPLFDCPSVIQVQLESGECEELVFFDLPVNDFCGLDTVVQTSGLESGSYFPKGITTQTFIATDMFGNTSECSFDVEMVEYVPTSGTLSCNDNINVSLDSDCQVVLGAGMLLEGNDYGCYADYIIEVSGGVTGNVITDPGTYTVTVTDPDTGNSCWSTVNVEGKSAPTLDCACPVGGTPLDNTFAGSLDDTDPVWTRPFVNGAGVCNPSGAGVDVPYDTYAFQLDMDANLGAEVVSFTAPSGDSFLALYADGFDPNEPCANLVITNDDGGTGLLSQIDVMLDMGVTYTLVVTTFNNNGNDLGDYVVEITSDATLLELAEECQFRCVDVDYVLNSDALTPNPMANSCTPVEMYFSDELVTDDCGTTRILRTWLAENANGSATCTQEFTFTPVTAADLTLPVSPVILSCNASTDPADIVAAFDNPLTNDNPNTPHVENNEGYIYAYPTYLIDGHAQKVDNEVCNIYAAYTDQDLSACGEGCNGNKKVIRTWTILDWCTLETTTFVQTIKAVDNEAPTLNTQDVTVSTDPWGCAASFEVPLPWELHDNCDSAPEYTVTGPAGVTITGTFAEGYTASGAPKGTHTFNYVAYDCCGNEESYPFSVTVVDLTPPVVVAKQNIVVSLTSGATSEDGYAKLYAESVDNGSFDGCSDEVRLEVRRDADGCDVRGNMTYNADGHPEDGSPNPLSPSYDPDGGAYVKFCCADIDAAVVDVDGDGTLDAGYHKVWIRVWDDGDMNGVYGSEGDNYNEAWAYVKVEDKLAPAIQCPADVTLSCDEDYTDTGVTGSAVAFGSCGGVEVEYNDIIVNLNSCNEGFVRRRWNVVGRSDVFCDQTITIEGIDSPVSVSFSQVGDFTAANCPDEISVGEPTWLAGPCDVMGYTVATDTFLFEDGACYKLVNTYTVINWCDYEPNNPFWNGEGIWEHTQVIKVTDGTLPVIADCEDQMYEVNDHADADEDGNVCEASVVLTNVATDEGSENCPTGWLKWQVIVDLWGDGTPDYEFSSFLPPFDSQFNDTNGNGIPDVYVSPTANGETVSIPLPDIEGSMSNHKVSWKVTDGCNNVTSCNTEFMVVDKKAPTPYCISVSTAVMDMGPDGQPGVEIWASDFNLGSFDNCTAEEDLLYSFSGTDYVPARTFTCEDVANSPVEVEMYVWDEKGNNDYCSVFLTIVDNQGLCEDDNRPDMAGDISTEEGIAVSEVEVVLNTSLDGFPRTTMTDDAGHYAFTDVVSGMSYGIDVDKDVDYLNGVSTLDLVKIQRHILGLESLDSPYKLIAADINADDDIKASDLSQLRKLILGVITDLPTNDSWRFVDADQELDMDVDLSSVVYALELANVTENMMNNDFVGVKVGDVTNNAVANLQDQSIEVRSNNSLVLEITSQEVVAGETVEVAFTSEDFADVYGYQFTMELNGLSFRGVKEGAVSMTEANVGVLAEDVVTVSYNSGLAKSAVANEAVFTVTFVATKDGNVSNMIDVTSKVTEAEAYVGDDLDIRSIEIVTRGEVELTEENALYQNEPNPFRDQTMIRFELVEAGKVVFTMKDATGKVVMNVTTEGVRGTNLIPLASSDLGASGVYFYTIESGEFTATKKLLLVK